MDQLRDRRTLFTITILPILLYPLLGMLMMQVSQFYRQNAVRISVIGLENWPSELPLLDRKGNLAVRPMPREAVELIEFTPLPWPEDDVDGAARKLLASNQADAVLVVTGDFRDRLNASNAAVEPNSPPVHEAASTDSSARSQDHQGLLLITNTARDQSTIANARLSNVIDLWWDQWRMQALVKAGLPSSLSSPMQFEVVDTAESNVRQAVKWSKILPFVMLVWALTGAFYPAVDLCAGEKERGTLETLLSSPARRREIVWGKLLAINVFSIASALLNLMSLHFTTSMAVKSLAASGASNIAETLGPVPIQALGWLFVLLIPMSAFFSALALAVAALARSTKEGQYYLMPLLLITLPLVGLPMIPSMEMNLGTSLIPVSGAVFLVRSLIEGRVADALVHLPVVFLVTLVCCWLATRWAVRQFESETVMFHDAGKWELKTWLRHLWRDRQDTARPSIALLCGVLILVSRFFMQFIIPSNTSFITSTLIVQIGLILAPCVIMALLLTRAPHRALRIHRTQWSHFTAAVLIGFALHPTYQVLGNAIVSIFPISAETVGMLEQFQSKLFENDLWVILLLLAALPAVCEELAFRGFIFGGLLKKQGVLRAIIVSAFLFGFTHAILQQSISASLMGLVLGLIAWRTGGVLCTIAVHFIINSLSLSMAWAAKRMGGGVPSSLTWAIQVGPEGWEYSHEWHFMSVVLSIALLLILFQRSHQTERAVMAEMA